ncbi:MAG: hypothetical protein IJJ69_14830 [Oscillospiraceae bacterium]|nr:hypothetical protein [Oscillospiraceae bacterium]
MKTNYIRKTAAVCAYLISILIAIGGLGGTYYLAERGCYTQSQAEFERNNAERNLYTDIENLNYRFENLKAEGYFDDSTSEQRKQTLYNDFMRDYAETRTNFFFQIYDSNDTLLMQSYQADYELFHSDTFYDEICYEEEKIMNEAQYSFFVQDRDSDTYWAQQIIVPHGDPAPTLPNEEPETETVTEQVTEPATEPETETVTEQVTEPATEPETESVQDSVSLVAHAEDSAVYISEYSIDEQISIADALNLNYEEDGENVWVYYNGSRIPFPEYFQNLISRISEFDIVTQNGWHYVIDKNQTPPQLMDISDYILNYPEKFQFSELIEEPETGESYDFYYDVTVRHTENPVSCYITGYIKKNLTAEDEYYMNHKYSSLAYRFRYAVPAVGIISGIIWLISLIYLIRSAGYHKNEEEARESIFEKIPFDLFTAVLVFLCLMSFILADEFVDFHGIATTVSLICGCAVLWGLALLWS